MDEEGEGTRRTREEEEEDEDEEETRRRTGTARRTKAVTLRRAPGSGGRAAPRAQRAPGSAVCREVCRAP